MDVVPGNDTGQHREEDEDSGPPTLTVMTAGVGEAVPPRSSSSNRSAQHKGGCEDLLEEDNNSVPPPSIVMPSQPEGGLLDDQGDSSASDDVETLNGKIVYNPDGSAYLIEGVDSELSDDEQYGGLDLFPFAKNSGSNLRTSPRPAASSQGTSTTPVQVVNALHIARHPASFLGAVTSYGGLLRTENNNHKVPEIPVMHSYRVFTLKDRTGGDDTAKVPSSSSSGGSNNSDTSNATYSVWDCGTVPVKPILMCFVCKLSFGYTKSFVTHATGEHSLSLNDAEKELVSRKNISAVIQGVGGAEPLLSFLEPIPPTSAVAPCAQTNKANSGGNSLSSTHGSVSSSSSHVVQSKDDSCVTSNQTAVTTVVSSASMCPVTSVPPDLAANSEATSSCTMNNNNNSSTSSFVDASLPELEDLAHIEKLAQAAAAAAQAAAAVVSSVPEPSSLSPPRNNSTKSSPSPPVVTNGLIDTPSASSAVAINVNSNNNQSNNSATDRMPNSLSPISSKTASSINHHLHQQTSPIAAMGNLDNDNIIDNISPKSTISSQSSTNQSPSPIAAGTAPLSMATCAHHPEGKINGVECPKCDMILGSSRSLGGHMTMMHSRNSCKTLKCPKCNWHYKYQETLEIHMKEKHPENEMTCLYCVTNQPHPRLARGETYTCGYKPYRCEVCNYSTTTKGNLSIHMQSDKHINNVQELQNGSLTPEHLAALQQQSQQQQQQQQQHSQTSGSPSAAALGVPSSTAASDALKKAQLAPKQKATWRCDVCNYETNVARNLRIHMTSEKHTHNIMVLQQNMKHMQHLSAMQQAQAMDSMLFHPGLMMTADAQLQPEAAIADITYNHALLMMASQQQQAQQQQQQAAQQQQQQAQQQRAMAAAAAAAAKQQHHLAPGPLNLTCSSPAIDLDHPDPTLRPDVPYEDGFKLFQCCVCTLFSSNSLEALAQHVQLDRSRLREEEVLTVVAGTSICKLCSYKTNLKANFQLHCKTDKHLQRLHHVNHVKEGGPANEWKLKYVNVSNPVQVRCNACEYYTNSLHKLQLHVSNPRHDANGRLFLFLERSESVIRTETKSYHCAMCNVSVRTKVNLIQHANSLAHIRAENLRQMQGESEPDMREVFIVKECKQASNLIEGIKSEDERESKMSESCNDVRPFSEERHKEETNSKNSDTSMLKQALLDRSASDGDTPQHTCPFCNFTSNSEVRIQMHLVSQHSQKPATLACPLCQDMFREWDVLENHVMDTHHVKKENLDKLMALVDKTEWLAAQAANSSNNVPEKKQLSQQDSNNVKVQQNSSNNSNNAPPPPKVVANGPTQSLGSMDLTCNKNNNDMDTDEPVEIKQEVMDIDCRSDSSSDSKEDDDFGCEVCGRIFSQVEDLFCHQNEMGHLQFKATPKGNGFFCWKKGCGLYFATMTAAQFHFKECHALRSNIPVSERHVYKYRCSKCSLAFKTSEKLTMHMQYHIMRAATKCVLCGRSFRTIPALQKHVEMAHCDMTKEELEQYRASLMNNPLLLSGQAGGILDSQAMDLLKKEQREDLEDELPDETISLPDDSDMADDIAEESGETKEQQVLEDYINSQAIAEDSYNDPNRKYKCHRCKVAFTRQSYLTSHNKTLLHRKGEKMSYPMEKYLDPNRPFKCEVCKESFTQKNILLVHYNSVSHLHKLKLSMKETGLVATSTAQKVGFAGQNDSSVLELSESTPSSEQSQVKPSDASSNVSDVSSPSTTTTITHTTKPTESRPFSITTTSAPVSSAPSIPTMNSSQFPFPLHPDHNNIMQQALGLMPPAALMQTQTPPYHCNRCGTMCSSPEALIQHQQLYCVFAQSQYPAPPVLNLQPNSASQNSIISSLSHAQQKDKDEPPEKQPRTALGHPETSASPVIQVNHTSNQRSPTPGQQMFKSRFPFLRPKPLIFRHLLEGFGFDVVMQFNENSQRRPKKEAERKEDHSECSSHVTDQGDKECQKRKIDLPEINRSICKKCGKGFSSIWVLKAHQEETHKDIVPIQAVEKFADEFREDYERRNTTVPVVDDATNMAEAPSPSSSGELSTGASSTPATPSGATPISVPNASTPPVTSLGSQMPDVASSVTANHMAAQMQFNQLLMSMGLGMGLPMHMNMGMNMNLPFAAAMNMHPPLIPLMMPPSLDPLMASAFGHPMMPGAAVDPNFFAAQQKLLQQQQLSQQQKRARTRINDDQLKILRAYFDINNSPTEEQLLEMSEKSGLPLKVIKHWFRNTLFKERQRNKDSPYNFNNPPSTYLNLEEYEKTGEAKITPVNVEKPSSPKNSDSADVVEKKELISNETEKNMEVVVSEMNNASEIKTEKFSNSDCSKMEESLQPKRSESNLPFGNNMTSMASDFFSMSEALSSAAAAASCTPPTSSSMMSMDLRTSLAESFSCNLNPFVSSSSMMPLMPPTSASPPTSESPHSTGTPSGTPTPSCSSSGKRANRTRFTDYQIKVLQEFFETNAYPKDDDLEYLHKLLNLSPRVIVVWFQNARQKARKVYENQPPVTTTEEENAGRFQRTPGLNYQCKKCLQVFQRYYELIKHQKSSCFKDENPLAGQIKVMSGDERSSQPSTPTLPTPTATTPPVIPRPAASTTEKVTPAGNNQNGTYRCDKCSLAFPRFELWREHQMVHMMNPTLFPSFPASVFPLQQYDSPPTPGSQQMQLMKRKLSDDEESQSDHPRDKRLRTTILPEQLDYLYQQYQVESNPSRKMLENIAREVGLKKRVVQVWFQNTRARERKGQFRAHQQVIHKRCPFCRALFKARSALESHLATRHADQYTKGDINIDALPDGEGDSNQEEPGSPSDDKLLNSSAASPSPNVPTNFGDHNPFKRYEDSLRKYLDELYSLPTSRENSKDLPMAAADLSMSSRANNEKPSPETPTKESPLDLSKPLKALIEKSNGSLAERFHLDDGTSRGGLMDDARSETYSESTDNMDGEESNPTSPSSRFSSNSSKRFRTQMTTIQLKVMKSIFVDYKTPSMCECENLGKEIGLPKRVVQVWFQNARAKEKKARLAFVKTFGHEMEAPKVSEECTLCNVKYNLKFSPSTLQEHLFSRKHIENLKIHIDSLKKLTDGQDSDTPSNYEASTPNHVANSPPTINSVPKQQSAAVNLSGLTGGLPTYSSASATLDKLKSGDSSSTTTASSQRKDTATNNGDVIKQEKQQQDDKDDGLAQQTTQENHSGAGDFPLPTSSSSETSNAPSSAAGLFPYMYAGFPGYYGGLPGTFLPHAMYPGAMHGGGMMYDSNMYSSPLSLLQLPASALPEVTGRLAQPGNSVARFSQDGKTLADLRTLVPEPDFRQAAEVTVDVGFVCKKCHTVYPAEVLCLNHQRTACFQNKPVGEIKATLKLVQCHVECRACKERFTTVVDFKFHCDMDRHVKRVQKIQREAANNSASNAVNNNNNNNNANFENTATSNFNRMALPSNSGGSGGNNSAAAVSNHFDAMVSRMAAANAVASAANNNNNNNNTFANDAGNAAAAGLLGCRNGMLPDMAQLFFSGMNIDALRLQLENAESKSKTSAVGCGVDAIS